MRHSLMRILRRSLFMVCELLAGTPPLHPRAEGGATTSLEIKDSDGPRRLRPPSPIPELLHVSYEKRRKYDLRTQKAKGKRAGGGA